MPHPHHLGISETTFNLWDGDFTAMRECLLLEGARRAAAQAPRPETPLPRPEPEAPRQLPVSGTPIVTNRRTRCPKCGKPVERDSDAVMMDGTEYGYTSREAFHVGCAEERGWRRQPGRAA